MTDRVGLSVWCGRCHRDVEPEQGTGTAWTLWVCPLCRGMVGTRIKREDIGPVDTAALDEDYEPIWMPERLVHNDIAERLRRGEADDSSGQAPLPASVSATPEGSQRGRNER